MVIRPARVTSVPGPNVDRYSNCVENWPPGGPYYGTPYVNCGKFWDRIALATPYGLGTAMRWRAIASLAGGKLVSDGYGGAHALLWDGEECGTTPPTYSGGGEIAIADNAGNYIGPQTEWFCVYGTVRGEWGFHEFHMLPDVAGNLWTCGWLNGVIVGRRYVGPAATRQRCTVPFEGAGQLNLFGAEDHATGALRCAGIQAFDRSDPYSAVPFRPYVPERVFGKEFNGVECDFLMTFDGDPTATPVDASSGYDLGNPAGAKFKHPGKFQTWNINGTSFTRYLYDPYNPYGKVGDIPNPHGAVYSRVQATPTVPSGNPLAFDDFIREDSDWFWMNVGGPTPGATDSRGALGALTYVQSNIEAGVTLPVPGRKFGILKCRFRCWESLDCAALVNVGQSNVVVQFRRDPQLAVTGMMFRATGSDAQNGQVVWTRHDEGGASNTGTIFWREITTGGTTATGSFAANTTWTYARVLANGTTLTYQIDDGSGGWTTVGTRAGVVNFQSGTWVGPASIGNYGGYHSAAFHSKGWICWAHGSQPSGVR